MQIYGFEMMRRGLVVPTAVKAYRQGVAAGLAGKPRATRDKMAFRAAYEAGYASGMRERAFVPEEEHGLQVHTEVQQLVRVQVAA